MQIRSFLEVGRAEEAVVLSSYTGRPVPVDLDSGGGSSSGSGGGSSSGSGGEGGGGGGGEGGREGGEGEGGGGKGEGAGGGAGAGMRNVGSKVEEGDAEMERLLEIAKALTRRGLLISVRMD